MGPIFFSNSAPASPSIFTLSRFSGDEPDLFVIKQSLLYLRDFLCDLWTTCHNPGLIAMHNYSSHAT